MSVRPAGASDTRLARSTAVAGEDAAGEARQESAADSADSYGRLGDTLSDLEQQFEQLDDHLS